MIGVYDRPNVTLHYAQTLDGRIATRTGHARWISCDATLRLAHELRAQHDAVLVGIGTVLADDPRLTVRLVPGASPTRVILDSTLRVPLTAHILTGNDAPTLLATTRAAGAARRALIEDTGAEVAIVESDGDSVSLTALLTILRDRGVGSVLVEGGAAVITSFLRQGLVDRLVVCVAPKIAGAGIEAVGDLGIRQMGDALRLRDPHIEQVGDDLIFDGTVASPVRDSHD